MVIKNDSRKAIANFSVSATGNSFICINLKVKIGIPSDDGA